MVVAEVGARRGSTGAFVVWLGCVGYIAYSYAIYAFSAHFNVLFLVYVATFGIGTYTLVFGLAENDAARVARMFGDHTPMRPLGVLVLVMTRFAAPNGLGPGGAAVFVG